MTDDYDAEADVWKSYAVALQAIRERMAAGGPPWLPKDNGCGTDCRTTSKGENMKHDGTIGHPIPVWQRRVLLILLVIAVWFSGGICRAQTYPTTITGTCAGSDTVIVFQNGTQLGTAPCLAGVWTYAATPTAGIYTFTAQQSSGGNVSWVSPQGLIQSVGPVACGTPTSEPAEPIAGPSAVVITSTKVSSVTPPKLGGANFSVAQSFSGSYPNYGTFVIAGSSAYSSAAIPGATVALYQGSAFIGSAIADPTTGAWSITTTLAYTGSGLVAIRGAQTVLYNGVVTTSPLSAFYSTQYGSNNDIAAAATATPASGNVSSGGTFSVAFSMEKYNAWGAVNVTVTGHPQLVLNTGDVLTYASGSGTSTLTFTGTMTSDVSTAGATVQRVNLNGGTLAGVELTSFLAQFPKVSLNYPQPVPPTMTCVQVN